MFYFSFLFLHTCFYTRFFVHDSLALYSSAHAPLFSSRQSRFRARIRFFEYNVRKAEEVVDGYGSDEGDTRVLTAPADLLESIWKNVGKRAGHLSLSRTRHNALHPATDTKKTRWSSSRSRKALLHVINAFDLHTSALLISSVPSNRERETPFFKLLQREARFLIERCAH